MTIMTDNTAVNHTPDPREKSVGELRWTHQNPHPYHRLDPVEYLPDGVRAQPVPGDRDPDYGTPTTDADIFADIDRQSLGGHATGYTVGQAGGFTRRRRKAGAPKMTVNTILDLQAHRVARAIADIFDGDWNQVTTAPYATLADLCLAAKDRTGTNATKLAAADRQVDPAHLTKGYRSRAEEILAALDAAPADDREVYGDDGDLLHTSERGTVTVADYTKDGLFPSQGVATDTRADDPADADTDNGGGFDGDDPAFVDAFGGDHGFFDLELGIGDYLDGDGIHGHLAAVRVHATAQEVDDDGQWEE